jgi:hypothetical protein
MLLNGLITERFLEKLMSAYEVKPLYSDEYFSDHAQLLQARSSYADLRDDSMSHYRQG